MSVSAVAMMLLPLLLLRCAGHIRDRLLIGLSSSSGLLDTEDIVQAVRAGGASCPAWGPSVISC